MSSPDIFSVQLTRRVPISILATHGQHGLTTLSWSIIHELFDILSAPDDFVLVTGDDMPVAMGIVSCLRHSSAVSP